MFDKIGNKRKLFIALLAIIALFVCALSLSSCSLFGSSGLRYKAIEKDGEVVGYSVEKNIGTNPETLTIPAEHNGKPVTKIERFGFNYCTNIENVVLPDTITEIGWDAFANCQKLKKVYISDLTAWCNISFEGDWATPFCYGADLYLNNELVKDLVIPDDITKIPMYVFQGSNISSVTLLSGVERIYYGAFTYCNSLERVAFNEGLTSIDGYAFGWCESLEEAALPEGLKNIGDCAFFGCSGLVSVTLPSSVESIDSEAFKFCERIAVVYNHSDFEITKGSTAHGYLGSYALNVFTGAEQSIITKTDDGFMFYAYEDNKLLINYTGKQKKITLPAISEVGYYKIGASAFSKREYITEVTIPDGVQTIGGSAFTDCISLTKVVIPQSVTYIGGYAFFGCKNLAEIELPENLTEISSYTFCHCESLKSIAIPKSVNTFKHGAFFACVSLECIEIPEGVTALPRDLFIGCTNLKNVKLPQSLSVIGESVFRECIGLEKIDLPDGLREIKARAFEECVNLKAVVIPDGVTEIGSYAFRKCDNIESVVIPDSVIEIKSCAFRQCSNLKSITLPARIKSIGEYAFRETSVSEIIFKGTVEQWNTIMAKTHWNIFHCDYTVYCTDGQIKSN